MRRRSPRLWLAATCVALGGLSCDPARESGPPGAGVEDAAGLGNDSRELLLSRAAVAEKRWDGVLLELGTPGVRPLLDDGWSYGETAADGNTLRWSVASEAAFHFESEREGTFLAWVECEPFLFDGGPTQWMRPTVNGEELPAIELRAGRARYPFEIRVRRGENRVAWRFRYAGAPGGSGSVGEDRRKLAVAFYRFDVPFDGAAPVAGLPAPFSWVTPATGEPGLFLPPGGSVRIFATVPRGGRLRVAAGASEPTTFRLGSGASLHVDVKLGRQTLLTDTLSSSFSDIHVAIADARVPASNEILAVTLRAEGRGVLSRPELVVPPEDDAAGSAEPGVGDERDERAAVAPNLLVIVLDGANALRTSAYGYGRDTTPVLEELARKSVVFETAVSQAVYTIASIGSFLTGQYPERHRGVSFAARLPDEAETLPERLSGAGYRTAGFSGNAVVSSAFGLHQGFEEFAPVWEDEEYTGHGDSVVAAFRDWLGRAREERFFAYVHLREPHFPYNPPPPYDTLYSAPSTFPDGIRDWDVVESINRAAAGGDPPPPAALARIEALYDGNLHYADALVGDVLALLAANGVADETIVVVTADHGEALFEHGFIGHNTQLYEESVRIPLLIHGPGLAPRRVSSLVELLDLTPTLLELAGADADPRRGPMQGRSLVPLLRGGDDGPSSRLAFIRTVWDQPRYAVRSQTHKLIWDSRTGRRELYDLREDPGESNDLLASAPADDDGSALARVAGLLEQEVFHWLRRQEHLRSRAPGPGVVLSDEERRRLESLGYAGQLEPEKKRP